MSLPTPDPGAMLQDSASIFPDPEQSMSVMTTGMIHSIIPEEEVTTPVAGIEVQAPQPLQVAVAAVKRKPLSRVVQELLDARPLVSFVTTEMTTPDVIKALPKGYPVITFGGTPGEVVLNVDQINPASLTWVKGATRGIHFGYESLKVLHIDASELREACYQEQVSILKRVGASNVEIADSDIALLSHYQQLISMLNFVINEGKDLVFDNVMLGAMHLVGRGIDLQAHLVEKFGAVDEVKVVVHSQGLSDKLSTRSMECCALEEQPTGDDDFKKLMLHQTVATQRAVQHFKGEGNRDQQARVLALKQELEELNKILEDAVAEAEAEAYSEAVKGKATLGEKVAAMVQELSTLTNTNKILYGTNEILQKNTEEAEVKTREVEEQLKTVSREVESKEEELRKLQKEQRASKRTEEELKRQLPATEGDDDLITRATALSRKMTMKEQEVASLKQELEQEQLRRQQLSTSDTSKSERLETANRELEKYKTVEESVQSELDALAQKYKLQLEGESLEDKVKFLNQNLAGKAELLVQMQTQLEELEATRTQLEGLLISRSVTPTGAEPETAAKVNLVEKVTELLEEIDSARKDYDRLNIEVHAKEEANERLADEKLNVEDELASTRHTLESTQESLDETTESLEAAEGAAVKKFEEEYLPLTSGSGSGSDSETSEVAKPLDERVSKLEAYSLVQKALMERMQRKQVVAEELQAKLKQLLRASVTGGPLGSITTLTQNWQKLKLMLFNQ